MSETLKFGAGKWATKEGSTLAYNSENGNFKPLPFDFERAGSATRVNKQGLIEVVGNNEPRIDFTDNSKGALLLEPTRTNVIINSENLNGAGWSVYGASGGTVTRTSNYGISPSGELNSTRVVFSDTTTALYASASGITDNASASIYVKGTVGEIIGFGFGGSVAGGSDFIFNGEWQRLEFNGTSASSNLTINTWSASRNARDFEVYGVQMEQGSYATSYIPTSGQANGVTRVADSSSQTVPDGVIGQTEGTIYFESTINGLQGGDMRFQLSDGSTNNWFFLSSGEATGIGVKARAYINNGNVNQFNSYSEYLSEGTHKYALSYKLNDIAFYVDGVQVALDSSATIPSCDEITLSGSTPTSPNTSHFLSYKDIKLYNTRLSNSELQALTQE